MSLPHKYFLLTNILIIMFSNYNNVFLKMFNIFMDSLIRIKKLSKFWNCSENKLGMDMRWKMYFQIPKSKWEIFLFLIQKEFFSFPPWFFPSLPLTNRSTRKMFGIMMISNRWIKEWNCSDSFLWNQETRSWVLPTKHTNLKIVNKNII